MDAKLKAKITKCAERVLAEIAAGDLVPSMRLTRNERAKNARLFGDEIGRFSPSQRAENARLFAINTVRRRLAKQRIWKDLADTVGEQWVSSLLVTLDRKATAAIREAELSEAKRLQGELFPGFEALPTKIKSGRNFLKFPEATVAQFLDYAAKYEKRAQKDQQAADEIRHLAEKVKPFAEIAPDITVADAFSRAKFNEPKLAVVKERA